MNTPRHHPSDALLLDYATGNTPEPLALLVACHLTFCGTCRGDVTLLEETGGRLLDEIGDSLVSDGTLAAVLQRIDGGDMASPPAVTPTHAATLDIAGHPAPAPLQPYLAALGRSPRWLTLTPALSQARLGIGDAAYRTRLVRARAGRRTVRHAHRGVEYTLVLSGAFSDQTGRYAPGDVQEADAELDHNPHIDPEEDCVCLIVSERPQVLTGPLSRFARPFARFF